MENNDELEPGSFDDESDRLNLAMNLEMRLIMNVTMNKLQIDLRIKTVF